jgi:hypothetical protein
MKEIMKDQCGENVKVHADGFLAATLRRYVLIFNPYGPKINLAQLFKDCQGRIVQGSLGLCLLLLPAAAQGQVSYQDGLLTIRNAHFTRQIEIPDQGSGPLRVRAVLDTERNNLLNPRQEKPLFEFVLKNEKVTALDPVWRYVEHKTRPMGNGGTEVQLLIEGRREPVRGLRVVLYQQFFPGSTLIREKLVLRPEEGRSFAMNKLDGRLHFVFPQYAIAAAIPARTTEIRIASWAAELIDVDPNAAPDERFENGRFDDHNLAMNHMYHPRVIEHDLPEGKPLVTKGPINILNAGDRQWISTYEHASQDDLRGLFRAESVADGGVIRDASQGTKGVFNFPISASDFHFLGFAQERTTTGARIAVEALRGAYLDGEAIDHAHPYSSVWTATAFSRDTSFAESRRIIHDYLWRHICEKPASRRPEFYYNTWGMQRRLSSQGYDLRGLLTEQKLKEEINRAAELGVDIFVLDDGWEQAQGDWTPNKERLPDGLAPIKAELDKHGIKMGVWFSPMGIDSTTQRYKEHPEWVILDSEGKPIGAQWDHPAFDFVSGFYDLFIEDCKKLVDAGVRFFKWDAINTFYSRLPNLQHGSDRYSDEEIRARYEYLLPIYVTRAMEELTDYEPELIIEVDLTEARRVMTGLAPLSQGKLFWMNNGASSYNDYSVYRAKSMRSIPNRYAGLIPLELFTYANYPHTRGKAQRYNVNTSLIAGHGFWGALEELSAEERQRVGEMVAKSKRVLPYIEDVMPEVLGRVGGSPEIYTLVDRGAGAGQVIAFSGQALGYRHMVEIEDGLALGVLNHAYQLENGELTLDFQFPMPDATREAFILPNEGSGVTIQSSTSWLDDLSLEAGVLTYRVGAPGAQTIRWAARNGRPRVAEATGVEATVSESSEGFLIVVQISEAGVEVTIDRD